MLNQELELHIDKLDVNENMKLFIKELLIYEVSSFNEINYKYAIHYDNLVEKYMRKY